jgi:hypothetical protein
MLFDKSSYMNQPNSTHGNNKPKFLFRRHRFIALFLFNATLLVSVFVAFELGLRIFTPDWLSHRMDFLAHGGPQEDFGTDRSWKVVKENDRFAKFVPHSEFDVSHAEYQTIAKIDELGGRAVTPQVSSSGKVIGCLGDSFTFGVGVANGETFVDHLQPAFSLRLVNL